MTWRTGSLGYTGNDRTDATTTLSDVVIIHADTDTVESDAKGAWTESVSVNANLAVLSDAIGQQSDARSGAIDGSATLFALQRQTLHETTEVARHFHSRARWLGKKVDQSGDDWASDVLAPFVLVSGDNTWGVATKILGPDDTPIMAGCTKFDPRELLVTDVDHNTPYKIRFIYGKDVASDAVASDFYSETMVQFDAANPQLSAGTPVTLKMPRMDSDTKIFAGCWNATDASELAFVIGVHCYPPD